MGTPTTTAVLIVTVGARFYAIDVHDIVEVNAMVQPTPLPDAPPSLAGAVNRHGAIIPLLDLRVALGGAGGAITAAMAFVVVQGPAYMAALLVDDVQDVITFPAGAFRFPVDGGPYVRGVATQDDHPLPLLNIPALLGAFVPAVWAGEETT